MPEWTWSPQWKAYRDMSNGQWASRAQIQEWVTDAVELADSSTDELSRLIGDVKIDARTWHTAMREQIKEAYKQQYLLGKGGIEQMTAQDWGSIGGMIADQYRYLDKFAQQIADGKLSEGGDGSGWFAPPKGTHTKKGGESGIVSATPDDTATLAEWLKEVQEEWPERVHWDEKHRTLIARRAIEAGSNPGTTTHALFEDGELVAVVNIKDEPDMYMPYLEFEGMREITYMATKRAGYGLKASLMALQQIGPEGAWWYANEESKGFYERMGALTPAEVDPQDIVFYIPAGFKELSQEMLERMDLTDFEPESGVFIVTRNPLGEGGDGSGWFAPPKGTHGPGSQGGDPEKTRARKRKLYALNAAARLQVKRGIADCAESGYKYGIESAVCVADNGVKVNGTLDGDEDSCNVGGFGIAGDRAHVLVHNHPNATSFSEGDFRLMINWPEVEHFVVVSGDGSLYRLSRTADTISRPTGVRAQGVFQAGLKAVGDVGMDKWINKYNDRWREMRPSEAWRITTEEAAQEMAVFCGLEYEHIPPPPLRIGG